MSVADGTRPPLEEPDQPGDVPRLVSVNVGLPTDVAWRGRAVHTGIWKSPVEGPRMLRRLNLDGDGQGDLAGHGGEQRAVYVYQLESYRHWAAELHRDDFDHGQFGENFTIAGLPDNQVCIGDRFRVGEALVEVTQPRVTCFRVGIRMDEPRMASLLTGSNRTGFYLRVLEEGLVEAGQPITKVADGPEQLTVAEANALLYRGKHPRAELERALRIAALSPGWQASYHALLDAPPDSGNAGLTSRVATPPAWTGFATARIIERRRESADVWTFLLDLDMADDESRRRLAASPAGQFLTLRMRPDPHGAPLLRSYSLSARPGAGRAQISVKREPYGAGGRYLVDTAQEGDHVEVAAPRGDFTLRPGGGPVALWSAGIGITPVLAMLETLSAGEPQRPVWWLHGARDRAHHPFAEHVDALLRRLRNGHRLGSYSRPAAGDRHGVDYDAVGRLTAELTERIAAGAQHYLCGPTDFLATVPAGLVERGVPAEDVHTEVFGSGPGLQPGIVPTDRPAPHVPAGPPGTGPLVSFTRSGVAARYGAAWDTVLGLAEACDVPVRWSCRTGVCHTCEVDLLAGELAYDPEPIDVPPGGRALICCSRPVGDVVLDL
jgi:MOSC domain-containing protein YiiM/ferredoxin-NADP reductase/ferredoxin